MSGICFSFDIANFGLKRKGYDWPVEPPSLSSIEQPVRWPIVLIWIHRNRPSVVALILSTEWSMQAGRAVLMKTTKSAQADLLAPPNSIYSRSHNFPSIAPIDALIDRGRCSGSIEEIRVSEILGSLRIRRGPFIGVWRSRLSIHLRYFSKHAPRWTVQYNSQSSRWHHSTVYSRYTPASLAQW